jgi:hypothetical protein
MKRLLMLALCALAMMSCGRGYKFEVVAKVGYPNSSFYLSPLSNPETYYVSGESDDEGVVRFEGRGEYPMAVGVSDGVSMITGPFFLEEGSIVVERLAANPKMFVAHGTCSNDAYVEYIAQLQQASHMFDTIQEMSDSVEARMQVVFDSLDRAVEESNYDNFLGLYLFVNDGIRRYSTRAEVDSVVSLFAPELREHPYMIGALQVFEEAK